MTHRLRNVCVYCIYIYIYMYVLFGWNIPIKAVNAFSIFDLGNMLAKLVACFSFVASCVNCRLGICGTPSAYTIITTASIVPFSLVEYLLVWTP